MDWFAPVDLYCERLGPGILAEPLNAVSNVAFLLAGGWLYAEARRQGADMWTQVLCLWVVAVGIGSLLFHTLATRWAVFADVVPIWSLVLIYIIYALRRYLRLSALGVVRGLALGAAIVAVAFWLIPESAERATNGSIQYLPALLALLLFPAALYRAGSPAAAPVLAAMAIFVLSLVMRSIDMAVCTAWPSGTHYAWHVLNGIMLAVLLLAALRHGAPQADRA